MNEVWKIVLTACVTILGGVIVFSAGQLIQRFWIEPLHQLRTAIAKVEHLLVLYGDVVPRTGSLPDERRAKAREAFCQAAAELRSHLYTTGRAGLWISRLPSQDKLLEAAGCPIGMANSLERERYLDKNLERDEQLRILLNLPSVTIYGKGSGEKDI